MNPMRPAPQNRAGLILVVDDDPNIARLVEAYLQRAGYRVALAFDGLSALRLIRDLDPDLIVLDLMLPHVDGLSVARATREDSDTPIVMLSARGSAHERVAGLEGGADDYIAKPFTPSELVARVRSVLRRSRRRRDSHPLRLADLVIEPERHRAVIGGRELELTAVEFELLRIIVEGGGRVLTRAMLTDALHSHAGPILDRSIDVYVQRLRAKLEDDPKAPRYVVTVRGVGYKAAV